MHANYEVSISHSSKVMENVNLTTDKQTRQKQYASNNLIWGLMKLPHY